MYLQYGIEILQRHVGKGFVPQDAGIVDEDVNSSKFIHGIVVVGAMIALGHAETQTETIIGFVGVLLGAGNAAGGYVVTERMLEMFKSSKDGGKG